MPEDLKEQDFGWSKYKSPILTPQQLVRRSPNHKLERQLQPPRMGRKGAAWQDSSFASLDKPLSMYVHFLPTCSNGVSGRILQMSYPLWSRMSILPNIA
jgi:hypothetical protein